MLRFIGAQSEALLSHLMPSLGDVIHFHAFRYHLYTNSQIHTSRPDLFPRLQLIFPTASWTSQMSHRHLRFLLLNTEPVTLPSKLLVFQSFQARKLGIISNSFFSLYSSYLTGHQVLLIPPYKIHFCQPPLCYSPNQGHHHLSSTISWQSLNFLLMIPLTCFPRCSQNFTLFALSLYT